MAQVYTEGRPIIFHEGDLTPSQLADIMNRSVFDEKAKKESFTAETNVVVTKVTKPKLKGWRTVQQEKKKKNASVIIETNRNEHTVKSRPNQEQTVNLFVVERDASEKLMTVTVKEGKNSANTSSVLCANCGKNFFSNYNLKRHMGSCKLCPDLEKGPRYQCTCGRSYSQEWDMRKHKASCSDNKSKCKSCLYPGCDKLFYHKSQLVTHMKKDHAVGIQDPEVLEFDSIEEFQLWKEREEEDTYTYYSKQTGSNVTGVSVNTYYVCQHDGSDRTHGACPRKTDRRNKKGRIKTGRFCWSQMNVKEFRDGTVRVTYFPSHTHPVSAADTEHHPLPLSISSEIKRRLSDLKSDDKEQAVSNAESKKARKGYGVNLRTLRALARKNRKLFRITAEAVEGADDPKVVDPVENRDVEVVGEEKETVELIVADEPPPEPTRDLLIQSCSDSWCQLKTYIDSGRLNHASLTQIQSTLANLVDSCHDGLIQMEKEDESRRSLCEFAEVLYQQENNLQANSLSLIETTHPQHSEKTVYQVVNPIVKNEPLSPQSENLLYQNVELISPREFIIIANDHAQIFQTVDPVQLSLS